MESKKFGRKGQNRNTGKETNKFKLKRKATSEFQSYTNNQKKPRFPNRPNAAYKKKTKGKGRKDRLNIQRGVKYNKFERVKIAKIEPQRTRITNKFSKRQRQNIQQKMASAKGTKGDGLKLFTKTFDARKKIDAKRKRSGRTSTNGIKADSKASLEISRGQSRDAHFAKRREMLLIGNQMKIISRVQCEDERRTSFTGTSLQVTTLQTTADRLKHRETLQSGNSLMITALKGEEAAVEEAEDISEYSLFEARRKAQQSSRVAAESEQPKLLALSPISRPKRLHPVYETEEESSSWRILISNLHPNVSQDDIYELFAAVAPLQSARMIRNGVAEVVYHSPENATVAYKKYHGRNLDGQPMICKVAPTEQAIYAPPSSRVSSHTMTQSSKSPVSKPVVFTVKI